jgi:protein phosphatase
MQLAIPELALVALIGASGAGKSTFARRHFLPTEVLSSDTFRGLVSDDENDQSATSDAFDALHYLAGKRLTRGRLTVVDATNVQPEARKGLLAVARAHHCMAVAIVFNLPERLCQERNRTRPDRQFGPHVVRNQTQQLRRSLRNLTREGFQRVFVLDSPDEVEAAEIVRERLRVNRRDLRGPFDIIGDVHGCADELRLLLGTLGYEEANGPEGPLWRHPDGRTAVFLGDLVDRGPGITQVLALVMAMVASGAALCIEGNHESKLLRKLRGRNVQVTHGLAQSLAQLGEQPPEFGAQVERFLGDLPSHYVLDDGKLVVAHAGLKQPLQGRSSRAVQAFALYGETTGETDEFGLPVRANWAGDYRGPAMVVYGHTPVPEPEWQNGTINVDTGCVFGGRLTALRYPEQELVSVPAARVYYEPARPLATADAAPAEAPRPEDLLDLQDVLGKRFIETRLHGKLTIREEQASAALEVMSRFAVDPRWLVYLPPTMSPTETSLEPDLLEHPAQAFAYYRGEGVPRVVCEEKHMGSRAVAIVCREPDVALRRFRVNTPRDGVCYTRTGRPFFDDAAVEAEVLTRLRGALEQTGLWERLETDWVCLDAEIMPWSAKAQALLRQQYAAVGAAARGGLQAAVAALERAADRGAGSGGLGEPADFHAEIAALRDRYAERLAMAQQYVEAYRRYCWPVDSVADLRIAPFHLLASEGAVHADQDHVWHMETLAELCAADPALLVATPYRVVDVTDAASEADATRWWEELTGRGGEGMVVKPLDFTVRGPRSLAQPAVKCRGREYLRIIYGPEYTTPENLAQLRRRAVGRKRALASREFALGIESLERFVRREPLYRTHECAFGVLALESEPVDPRL